MTPVPAAKRPRVVARLREPVARLTAANTLMGELSVDLSGRWIAVGAAWNRRPTLILDASTLEVIATLPEHCSGLWAPDRPVLYAVKSDHRLDGEGWAEALPWDGLSFGPPQWRAPLHDGHQHYHAALDATPTAVYATLAASNDPVVVLDPRSGRERVRLHLPGSADATRSVIVNPVTGLLYISRHKGNYDNTVGRSALERRIGAEESHGRAWTDRLAIGVDPIRGRVYFRDEQRLLVVLDADAGSEPRTTQVLIAEGSLVALPTRGLLVPPIHDRIVLLDAATLAPVHEGADRLPGVRFAVADRAERRLYVLSQVTEDGQPVGVLRAYDLVDE